MYEMIRIPMSLKNSDSGYRKFCGGIIIQWSRNYDNHDALMATMRLRYTRQHHISTFTRAVMCVSISMIWILWHALPTLGYLCTKWKYHVKIPQNKTPQRQNPKKSKHHIYHQTYELMNLEQEWNKTNIAEVLFNNKMEIESYWMIIYWMFDLITK